ncbi:MAG: hypothetical protein ACK4GT_10430 [Pararhodobacter sp.]
MFARNRFPIAKASGSDDMMAMMAHAMGCGTMVEPECRAAPASAPVWRPVTLPRDARAPARGTL